MKLRILVLFSVMLFAFTACKKDPISAVDIENTSPEGSIIKLDTKEELVLAPRFSGKAKSFQWTENEVEVGTGPTYKFVKEEPGNYTVVFKIVNEGGTSTLTYNIKVLGVYGKGILLLSNGDGDIDEYSEISYINEKGELTNDVFGKVNPGKQLSPSALNLYHSGSSYYITSMEGPNYLTVIDDQTLKLQYTVNQSGVTGINYFATTDGKTGYVNVDNGKPGIYPVDLLRKSISSTRVAGTSETPFIPLQTVKNSVVTSSGNQLLQIENNTAKVLYTYKEDVAGVVTPAGKMTWVGVQGSWNSEDNKPKFVKLDENLKEIDVAELDPKKYRLPANGILTTSGADNFIYWQETSTGEICRFNTATKTAEVFIKPATEGIAMMTAWKVNPANGDVYVINTPGIFMGENASNLFIFDKTGKKLKELKNVGHTVMDIAFSK